jgi:hypothetical protein
LLPGLKEKGALPFEALKGPLIESERPRSRRQALNGSDPERGEGESLFDRLRAP